MSNRLALGTVQFGLSYGVANSTGRVRTPAVAGILRSAAAADIDTLDTAIAYGDSEAVLGEVGVSAWRIVTKLPPLTAAMSDVAAWVQQQISGSLQRLNVPRVDAVLLHRPADLLGPHGVAYRKALAEIKAQGLTSAVGVSIYAPAELDVLWPVFRPDVVQTPLNVIDRRLLHTDWPTRLVDQGVRLHCRSAFLQGLLLMTAKDRPPYFEPWCQLLDRWVASCNEQDVSPLRAALNFVLSQPGIERIIVGVDSEEQLKEILEAAVGEDLGVPADLYSDDLNLIEPSRWKLK